MTGEAERIEVPSGQEILLQEIISNEMGPQGLTMRFRFVAPQIARMGGTVDFDTASADMLYLCQEYAFPRAAGMQPAPRQIVISLSDTDLPFGKRTRE